MEGEFLTVFCTFPDLENARRVIDRLVSDRLIACGNIFPGIESIYRWKDKIERSSEVLGILKTRRDKFSLIESVFKELHTMWPASLQRARMARYKPVSLGGHSSILRATKSIWALLLVCFPQVAVARPALHRVG